MAETDGKWIMEGLDLSDSSRIKTCGELCEVIREVGFLPLFKNEVKGFSVEEMTASSTWWGGNPEEDPWLWREIIAEEGKIAYGKLFANRAGFISRDWYPIFASYRRDGYDFDSRYEDGLASHRAKKIMDLLDLREALLSNEIKTMAGFGKEGEKGFEGAMTALQMQTYITVRCFRRRINKKNEEYGWSVAQFSTSERLYGEEHVRSAYCIGREEARQRIVSRVQNRFPAASLREIERVIR
ncbi:hypothetical protein HNQ56_004214 [Anaerotaenia torta]|uniref:AlkZ-related protein n=1 Tax=Anaerotaenia torta TaxID=433293 RepID=UPI003D223D41